MDFRLFVALDYLMQILAWSAMTIASLDVLRTNRKVREAAAARAKADTSREFLRAALLVGGGILGVAIAARLSVALLNW